MKTRSSSEYRHQPHLFQQLTDCDIVKRGTLYIKHPPSFLPTAFSIQPWKKRYVVLRDTWYCSPCVVTSLDIYDSEPRSLAAGVDCRGDSSSSSSSKARSFVASVGRHEPYSVDLRQVTSVGFHLESRRFQFAFYVERCDDRPLLFAAESDLEMRCWVAALRMLADKARVAVQTSPDSKRSSLAASSTSPDRRCTIPSDDMSGVQMSLDARRRNLSDSQLHAVPSAVRRYVHPSGSGQLRDGLQRKLTAPDIRHPTSAMSSLNEVDAESLVSAHSLDGAAADVDGHLQLRRMFSASLLGSFLRRDVASRWRAFAEDRRKDSGFSESFDDGTCDWEQLHRRDSPDTSSPPPTPPPRPPPRRTTVVNDGSTTATPLSLRHPPPPPPAVTAEHDVVDRPESAPPTPPPRPPHTLLAFSCDGVH